MGISWCIEQITDYLNQKHVSYKVLEASTGSYYFTIGPSKVRVRISNHHCGVNHCFTLRYDLMGRNLSSRKKIALLQRTIDNVIKKGEVKKLDKIFDKINYEKKVKYGYKIYNQIKR